MAAHTPSLDDSLSLNHVIKIEDNETSPITFIPSTNHAEDAFAFSLSTLAKVLLGLFVDKFVFPSTLDVQLTRFPVLARDVFGLDALSHFKTMNKEIPKTNIRSLSLSQKAPSVPQKVKKVHKISPIQKQDVPTTNKTENLKVNDPKPIEQQNEEKAFQSSQKITPKTKVQNRIKNIPGLIVQRVRTNIKIYLTRNIKYEKQENRLNYIDKVFKDRSRQDREKIYAFLESYDKKWKTWTTIESYLRSDVKCGEIFLDAIMEFLGEEGLEDFEQWMATGKMREKSKVALADMKERIRQKFSRILMGSDTNEEEDEELALKDKIIKIEDSVVKKEEHL